MLNIIRLKILHFVQDDIWKRSGLHLKSFRKHLETFKEQLKTFKEHLKSFRKQP